MFERWASDPNISVEKIERLMALWERNEARQAEIAFNAAMSEAQKDIRPVARDAENPQTHSRYASYKALDDALRPIYTTHGFALSFNTGPEAPPDTVRVLCYATHSAGHTRVYSADMPADGKGARGGDVMTKTHATGSAMTYGMRYLLKMIFNVAIGEDDDDGNRAGKTESPRKDRIAPEGYEDWANDLRACADEGWPKLSKMWNEAKTEYRTHLTNTNRDEWERLKEKAKAVSERR
jgi:hypothetical protein